MKFMLIMNSPKDGYDQYMSWPKKILEAHGAFMQNFATKLQAAGELVHTAGLDSPKKAQRVRAGKDGKPITDGAFAESKELLAGYWIVDVENRERALEIAAEAATAPGGPVTAADGSPIEHFWIEVRQVLGSKGTSDVAAPAPEYDVERLLRDLAPQVLGAAVRRFHDFSASEDAVQEALIAAAAQWPSDGVPGNPLAWLMRVAHRRMIDHVRRENARRNRDAIVADETPIAIAPPDDDESELDPGDTLVLLFMCCHPALTPASAIALTLRAVGGLTTTEIARAFLVPEATIARRISRAKESIKESGIPFAMPDAGERAERLESVLHVLYLVFNEGYTTSSGSELHRSDLSNEAIRLVRDVRRVLPNNGDVCGLLALMLLIDARRAARTGPYGELIPLDEQDRTRWNQDAIAEGIALADAALALGAIGEYQLQAAIAAVHDEAKSAADTDWPQILALYEMLMRLAPTPVVALNHAIAKAMVEGPRVGLDCLAELENNEQLRASHRLDAVRAHLLERAGELDAARELYRVAASKTSSIPERDYLLAKARIAERA